MQDLSFVHNRKGNVSVTWNDLTLIWGGYGKKVSWDSKVVHCHRDGKWFAKETCGDVPSRRLWSSAVVYDDKMYLLCGVHRGETLESTNDIFTLDLISWRWTKLNPSGTQPLKSCLLTAWAHNGRVYGFGGGVKQDMSGRDLSAYPSHLRVVNFTTNQLFSYNVSENCWEWPSLSGEVPSPRCGHTIIVDGDIAILFGGIGEEGAEAEGHIKHLNDLYTLNMNTMQWTRVNHSVTGDAAEGLPGVRRLHSMTLISPGTAVLFGGCRYRPGEPWEPYGDCWLFDVAKVRAGKFIGPSSSLWTRCQQQAGVARSGHSAVVEPVSKRLWILGGHTEGLCYFPHFTPPTEMLSISFNSAAPLRLLAMESLPKCQAPVLEAKGFMDMFWMHVKAMIGWRSKKSIKLRKSFEAVDIPMHLKVELKNRRTHMKEERRIGIVRRRPDDLAAVTGDIPSNSKRFWSSLMDLVTEAIRLDF